MAENLSEKDVIKLAKLARLELTDKEVHQYKNELSSILDYVHLLDKVDTKELKPTHQVTGLVNVTRPDEIIDYGYKSSDMMENVPNKKDGFIKVKRMIG